MIPASRRLARDERIPTLPAVVARLLAVYASEDYSLADIIVIIERDPSISTRLLRLANSAYCGAPSEVCTVSGAVMLLGSATVQGLSLGASLLKPWEVALAPNAVREVWTHSYLCAVGSRELSAHAGQARVGEESAAFVGGLLHDIGKILLLKRDPVAYAELLENSADDDQLALEEKKLFGEDHRELGFDALSFWNLPPLLAGLARARTLDDLRAEHRKESGVFLAVHELLTCGGQSETGELLFGGDLVGRVGSSLTEQRDAAKAFYESMAGGRENARG